MHYIFGASINTKKSNTMTKGQLMEKISNCELRFEPIGNGYAIWHMYSDITGHHSIIDAITSEQIDSCLNDNGYNTRSLPISKRVHEHWKGFLQNQKTAHLSIAQYIYRD